MPQTPRYSNVQTAEPQQFRFEKNDPRYKLAKKVDIDTGRTGRTGSYGTGSPFSDPRRMSGSTNNRYRGTDPGFGRGSWNWSGDGVKEASQRSTNKAVTVTAEVVEGSTRQTLGNRARVSVSNAVDRVGKGISAAKNAASSAGGKVSSTASSNGVSSAVSSAASAVGKVARTVSRTVSSSASGGVSVGAYKGGVGIGISRGGVDLGVGFASISYNFSNPNESSIGGFFNTTTITGTQEGCTIFLDYKFLGKTYFTETRQADKCEKPEPKTPGQEHNPNDPPPGSNDPLNDPQTSPIERTNSERTFTYNLAEPTDIWIYSQLALTPVRDSFEVGWGADAQGAARPITYQFSQSKYLYAKGVLGSVEIKENITDTKIPFYDIEATSTKDFIWAEVGGYIFTREKYYTISINKDSFRYLGQSTESRTIFTIYNIVNWKQLLGYWRLTTFWHYNPNTGGGNFLDSWRFLATAQNGKAPYRPYLHNEYLGNLTIKFEPQQNPNPFIIRNTPTPRGVKEPVDSRQQILLERVYQMLGGDRFWENGLAVPNEMFTPEADGNSTQARTYNEVHNLLFRTIDHRTPGQVAFPIPNGEYTSINAEGYFADLGKNVSELLDKANNPTKGDNSEVLGYLHRVSLLNTQAFNLLVKINELIKGIVGFLGIPMKETIEVVDIPFDPGLKGKLNKGFAKPEDLDKELEKLLKEQNTSEEKIKETVARYASSGKIPVRVKKLRQSNEGGDFWWLLRNGLNLKK